MGERYHTVSAVFYLEKEYRAAGTRLTASGSVRVESGRISSLRSILFFIADSTFIRFDFLDGMNNFRKYTSL